MKKRKTNYVVMDVKRIFTSRIRNYLECKKKGKDYELFYSSERCDNVIVTASTYTGYILSFVNNSNGNKFSFNCDAIDAKRNYINATITAMLERIAENSDSEEDDIEIVSITIPRKKYDKLIEGFIVMDAITKRMTSKI